MKPRLFELCGDRVDHLWWMQDGAPCHRTNVVRNRAIIGLILLPWRILVMVTFVAMEDIGYNRITFVVMFKYNVL